MANPLPDENAIYETLKEKNITIDPLVWELINHHVRNDLNVMSLAISSLRLHPLWILKFASFMIKLLYKVSLQPGKPEDMIEACDASLRRIKEIDVFLKKLKEVTYKV